MKYRKLGNSGIEVSVIGQGTWQMGNDFWGDVDENEAIRSLHASIDNGVNLIDTAPAYGLDGDSEKVIGKAVKDRRDKVVLATKLGILRVFGSYVKCLDTNVMRHELELSLKRLQTDYIDYYQIHWPEYNNSIEAALEQMVKFKEEGKVRAIGVSNFSIEQMQLGIDIADISGNQPPFSLLDRRSVDNGILPFCAKNNIGTLTYGTLAGGILAGKLEITAANDNRAGFYNYYKEPMLSKCRELLDCLGKIADDRGVSVAEVSINWALAQEGVTCALIGSSKEKTSIMNAKAADWEITQEELNIIDAEYKRLFLSA